MGVGGRKGALPLCYLFCCRWKPASLMSWTFNLSQLVQLNDVRCDDILYHTCILHTVSMQSRLLLIKTSSGDQRHFLPSLSAALWTQHVPPQQFAPHGHGHFGLVFRGRAACSFWRAKTGPRVIYCEWGRYVSTWSATPISFSYRRFLQLGVSNSTLVTFFYTESRFSP